MKKFICFFHVYEYTDMSMTLQPAYLNFNFSRILVISFILFINITIFLYEENIRYKI